MTTREAGFTYRAKVELREAMNGTISQPQMAKKTGIAQSHISRIVRGYRVGYELAKKISDSVGLNVLDAFEEVDIKRYAFSDARKEKMFSSRQNEIGKTYGRLTVISLELTERGEQKVTVAVCRCACGKEHKALLTALKSGKIASCGCMATERRKERIEMLREACGYVDKTQVSALAINGKPRADNTSGRRGVTRKKESGKWMAQLNINGEYKYLGVYQDFEAACEARTRAELRYFGHYIDQYECEKSERKGDVGKNDPTRNA